MKVGFCGLGNMGLPMARRLLQGGHHVTAWNRTAGRTAPLAAEGATIAATPREAAQGSDLVITMVSDPEALEAVVFGPDGAAEGMAEGALLIEMSTVGPDVVRDAAGRLEPRGVRVVDAPVRGSVPQAEEGTLILFVGGSDEDVARSRDVLSLMGAPRHVGPVGAGAAVKLVLNSCTASLTPLIGEAIALADALGLPQETTLQALEDSPVGPFMGRISGPLRAGQFPPMFRLALARKDLDLAAEAARRGGVELSVSGAARERLAGAERDGLGDLDYAAVVAHITGRPATEA